jgi:hypothetical protein
VLPAIGSTSRCVQWSGVPFSAALRHRHDWNRSNAGEPLLEFESNAFLQRLPGALFLR